MPTVKDYNVKITRLRGTRKITQTMKLVSANSLRRFQRAQTELTHFLTAFESCLAPILSSATPDENPLLTRRPHCRKAILLLITSDMGLCGGFNNSLARFAENWIVSKEHGADQVALSLCGRRGWLTFRDRYPIFSKCDQISRKPTVAHARRLAAEMRGAFLSGEYDAVYIGYNRFRNVMSQTPTIEPLLPIPLSNIDATATLATSRLIEPSQADFLDALLPKRIVFHIFSALLNSAAGENAARMTSMDSSTTNVNRLIDQNTLLRNRARQAAITRELNEIIAGAESLAEAV